MPTRKKQDQPRPFSQPRSVQLQVTFPFGPKHHERLYIPSGDITLQVEETIFKIHSYFLTQHSIILRDLLDGSQSEDKEGTDEKPLRLAGDSTKGWELILGSFYREGHLSAAVYTREELLAMLHIAHKYLMDSIEQEVLVRLKKAQTTGEYVDLIEASRIVGSEELYKLGVQGLIQSRELPSLKEAGRIGLDAFYAIISASARSSHNYGYMQWDRYYEPSRKCANCNMLCSSCGSQSTYRIF